MTSLVYESVTNLHLNAARADGATESNRTLPANTQDTRSAATLLMAAGAAALMVVASEFVDAWSEGGVLAGWMLLWVVAFASLALLARPARRVASLMDVSAREADQQMPLWHADVRRTYVGDDLDFSEVERAKNPLPLWHAEMRRAYIDGDLSRATHGIAVEDIRRYRHWPDAAGRF